MWTRSLAAVWMTVAFAGCVVETDEPDVGSAEQEIIFACNPGSNFIRYWKVNNVEVGREECLCSGELLRYGETRGTYSQVVGPSCSGARAGGRRRL